MTILVRGQNCTALVDCGAQVSTINIHLVKKWGLSIHKFETILNIEGMVGGKIPHLGYTKLELQILEIKVFREDALFLDIELLNKVDPLTAVLKCIYDSSSYCPCLYRIVL